MTHAASALIVLLACGADAPPPVLDHQALLDAQDFWDNRDWDWYLAQIPFLDCPDPEILTTYYYRWELVTKHLTYGSPASGYSYTEFIDRPFWSGTYGAISCPAGHQLYEVRWLRDPRYARDYVRYWFRTPGAQPRRYSTWLADAAWAVHQVHPDRAAMIDLLPDLVRNHEGWERDHFVPDSGLFWQTGHDDGMEININSRQTPDMVRGAPALRPTLNSYLRADAQAIARVADLAGRDDLARTYRDKAASLKREMEAQLWDPDRRFFFPKALGDETSEGFTVKAGSLTYQTGRFAGDSHGRELIGLVPWQFDPPGRGFEAAWKPLMDPDGFAAPFGPTTVERHDPLFLVTKTCCWWSGQSWPYATTQTLKAMANLLQAGTARGVVTADDYVALLTTYARTHRKDGRPYLAEAANPDTGSFEGYDTPGHSDHYFHSGFTDLVITGLVGLRPRDDKVIEVRPLAPADWAYFAIENVPYRGRRVTVVWDRDGQRYHRGTGLRLLADGREIASRETIGPLTAELPATGPSPERMIDPVNVAVNNDGTYYPRATASSTAPGTSVTKAVDGNYWYHLRPANRWTCEGSTHASDWLAIDFGRPRRIDTVKLYLLDDAEGVAAPSRFDLEFWKEERWEPISDFSRSPAEPTGHRANVVRFPEITTDRLRVVVTHRPGRPSGLTELEAWGDGTQPIEVVPPPSGNLAFNPGDRAFPRVSASFTSRFDRAEEAIDGRVGFLPEPRNRWTSYESPNAEDWLEIDFGQPREVARLEVGFYDDRGGVQAPADYRVAWWNGTTWQPADGLRRDPERPAGGQFNEVRFHRVRTERLRLLLIHRPNARSGLTELLAWPE